ncbi:MAG: hypothetical protein AB1646_12325 [Thermodesulfobacteriota bacterium]
MHDRSSRLLPAVFFVSFAAIAWQFVLMRSLLIGKYHHFSFLVISCALLGFGASGTLLAGYCGPAGLERDRGLKWFTAALGLSLPLCFRLGETLPVDVYIPPGTWLQGVGWWLLYWIIHAVPFLLAGTCIGLALMSAQERVARVYAANLVGSAAGALGAMLLLDRCAPNGLVAPLALIVMASGLALWPGPRAGFVYPAVCLALAVPAGLGLFLDPHALFPLRIDQYKTLAHVEQLLAQGSARREEALNGIRGRIERFSGPSFHTMLSLSSADAPPPMDILVRDGAEEGVLPAVKGIADVGFLDGTFSRLPYRLIQPESVLILGESGDTYLWSARMSPARRIVLVQPDPNVIRVLQNHPSRVLRDPRIEVVRSEPRAYLDRTESRFDLIHLAAMDGFAPGSSGIGGLRENHLATVEGFARVLDRLTSKGVASVVRGIQEPERDNLKIVATWIEALEHKGVADPGAHMLVARDELSCLTLTLASPVDGTTVSRFQAVARDLNWDTEWFPGIAEHQTNRVHMLPGPPGSRVSWLHRGIKEILSDRRAQLSRDWICDIRPATDDRPFFSDFFRWKSVATLRGLFGPLWPTRAEMGFLVLVVAAVMTAGVSLLLVPVPIYLSWRSGAGASVLGVIAFFGALGTGFMLLEMGLIQLFTRFLGDPVSAAAVVVGGLLFFAGLGSFVQPLLLSGFPRGMWMVTMGIAGLVVMDMVVLPRLLDWAGLFGLIWKVVLGLAVIAPLAVLMGMPFPWGLSAVRESQPTAIPLAWAVNGCASVVSTTVAVLIAMTGGFTAVLALGAVLYALAGFFSLAIQRSIVREACNRPRA